MIELSQVQKEATI